MAYADSDQFLIGYFNYTYSLIDKTIKKKFPRCETLKIILSGKCKKFSRTIGNKFLGFYLFLLLLKEKKNNLQFCLSFLRHMVQPFCLKIRSFEKYLY